MVDFMVLYYYYTGEVIVNSLTKNTGEDVGNLVYCVHVLQQNCFEKHLFTKYFNCILFCLNIISYYSIVYIHYFSVILILPMVILVLVRFEQKAFFKRITCENDNIRPVTEISTCPIFPLLLITLGRNHSSQITTAKDQNEP